MKIYPNIDIQQTEVIRQVFLGKTVTEKILRFTTTLRKKHKNKWYLWKFLKQYSNLDPKDHLKALEQFTSEVYICQILGKVSPTMRDFGDLVVFPLDPIQESEEDRLRRYLNV